MSVDPTQANSLKLRIWGSSGPVKVAFHTKLVPDVVPVIITTGNPPDAIPV